MTITELWRQYDNMMEKVCGLDRLLADMESEREDLLAEAEAALKAIDTMQGERDGIHVPTPRPPALRRFSN